MAKYARREIDDKGKEIWFATDGRGPYKTKAGAYKHSKKLEAEGYEPQDSPPEKLEGGTPPKEEETSTEAPPTVEKEASPEWVEMEFDIEQPSEVVPAVLKRIKPRTAAKPTKKQLEAERELNEGVLVVGYRTTDMMLTRYKRAVLDDPNADPVTHSSEDYQWIAGITQDMLDHNGLNLAGALGPNQIGIAANAVWFASPVLKIQAEAKRSPFQGRVGGALGRLLERVPFIGKRIKERRLRTIEQEFAEDG